MLGVDKFHPKLDNLWMAWPNFQALSSLCKLTVGLSQRDIKAGGMVLKREKGILTKSTYATKWRV